MEMWALYCFLYNDCSGTVDVGGGDHLEFKNQCHFQYDTTES